MGLLERMNEALQYIEENLTDEINIKEVSRLAFCSEYHLKGCFRSWLEFRLLNISDVAALRLLHLS